MKPKESLQPTRFMAVTVLMMMLSVSFMLIVGLASRVESVPPARPVTSAIYHSAGATQGAQIRALRGRLTRWVAYFARSG